MKGGDSGRAEHAGRDERLGRVEQTGRFEQAGRAGESSGVEQSDRDEQSGRAEQLGRTLMDLLAGCCCCVEGLFKDRQIYISRITDDAKSSFLSRLIRAFLSDV